MLPAVGAIANRVSCVCGRTDAPGRARYPPVMYKFALGVLFGLAAMAGAYAVAASTASGLAAGFDTREAASHSRSIDFATEVRRISDAHAAESAKCDSLAAKPKRTCKAESRAKERRGFAEAVPF
jgi:hypothetical protein